MSKEEKVTSLTLPSLKLSFKDENKDGVYEATLPIAKSGTGEEMPLLELARKHASTLIIDANNKLVAQGKKGEYGEMKGSVGGKLSSESSQGAEVGASGDVHGADANAKLTSGGKRGGEGTSGFSGSYTPGSKGLGLDVQNDLQSSFEMEWLNKTLDWANTHRRDLERHPEKKLVVDGVEITPQALRGLSTECINRLSPLREAETQRIEDGKGLLEKTKEGYKAIFSQSDAGMERFTALLDSTARGVAALPPIGNPPRSEADLSEMAMNAALNARLDPERPVSIFPSSDNSRFFLLQGDKADPSSHKVVVDPAQPPQAPDLASLVNSQTPEMAQAQTAGKTLG